MKRIDVRLSIPLDNAALKLLHRVTKLECQFRSNVRKNSRNTALSCYITAYIALKFPNIAHDALDYWETFFLNGDVMKAAERFYDADSGGTNQETEEAQ